MPYNLEFEEETAETLSQRPLEWQLPIFQAIEELAKNPTIAKPLGPPLRGMRHRATVSNESGEALSLDIVFLYKNDQTLIITGIYNA